MSCPASTVCIGDELTLFTIQLFVESERNPIGLPCHQGYAVICSISSPWRLSANGAYIAAVERVPEIKAEDVEEVFFGNVLSAGYAPPLWPEKALDVGCLSLT